MTLPQRHPGLTRGALAAVAALVTAAMSCSEIPAVLRRHTYPPNFSYITREQLDASMWQLADEVRKLDSLMRQPPPVDPARRSQLEALLRGMLNTAAVLQGHGRPTNHPVLSEHLDTFQRDLGLALAGVEAQPPNYYFAGSISGACLTCHAAD